MATGTQKKSTDLKPGIYAAARKLDLPGKPGGVHQFLILVPGKNPGRLATHLMKDLGGGTKMIVVGAHNMYGNLRVDWFQDADRDATKELTGAEKAGTSWSPQVREVDLGNRPVDEAVELILYAVNQYVRESSKRPIPYPKFHEQFKDKCINSNGWVHSVLDAVLGAGSVARDFDGADRCHENNIERSYFVGAPKPWRAILEVKPGDTLSGLCKKVYNKATPQVCNAVAKANHISNPNVIQPGQRLQFPELFSP
jgi:phage tail protein X